MALKPTIYKFDLNISDFDRDYYHDHALTLARHPSESAERMMARCLAFALNAAERLTFTTGLSTPDEPDLWEKSLDDRLLQWIDVGEPAYDRIKKACRLSEHVKVYSFNSKSDTWWRQVEDDFKALSAEVMQFQWSQIKALAATVERGMAMSISINQNLIYCTNDSGNFELVYERLGSN